MLVSLLNILQQFSSLQTQQLQKKNTNTRTGHLLELNLDISFTLMYDSYILRQCCQGLIVWHL